MMLKKAVDFFVHPTLKVDKSLYEKSWVMVSMFLFVYGITIIYSLFYLFISNGNYFDFKSILNYIDIITNTLALLLIKKTGKIILAFSLMAIVYFGLFVSSVAVSGGIYSYDIYWLIVLSSASFFFISIETGIIITILSFVAITCFFLLENLGITNFNSTSSMLTVSYKYFNISLILFLLSLMVYLLLRGNKKLQDILEYSEQQKIREDIARDFHDQIGNELAAIRHLSELTLISKSSEERGKIIDKIDDRAKNVYDNFRDFIWTLDAKSNRLSELFMYLRDFTDDYYKFSDVDVYITSIPENLPELLLPSHYSKEIISIFKEAITNSYKHSNAKKLNIQFVVSETSLSINLKDDGKGMDSGIEKRGQGLINMKNRVQKLGGALDINSAPMKGTEIVFTIILPTKGSVMNE
jgi:signal transduction histidine kinase